MQKGLVLSAAIMASGIGFLMSSAMNIAVPTIQTYFQADLAGIQWILNAYTLALGSLILVSGGLIDRFGLKRVYLLGMYLFLVGSALCAAAWSVSSLIGFRVIQGTGAALMVPGSLAAIKRVYPAEGQGKAIGLWAGISGAIAGLGPFLGGFLAELSWRYLFLSMLPLITAAIVMTMKALPQKEMSRGGLGGLDYPGFILSVAGLASLTYGLIRISDEGGLSLGIASIAAGLLLLTGFVLNEARRSKKGAESLVPGSIFTPIIRAANISTFFLYFAFSGVLFLLSLNLQQLQGFRPGTAGLLIMPATILIPFLSGPSGVLTDRIGPSFQMRLGPLLFAAGAALLLMGGVGARYLLDLLPGMIVLGIGMVLIIPAITSSAIAVTDELVGTASGINNAAARISGLFAVAVSGALLAGGYRLYYAAGLAETALSSAQVDALLGAAGQLTSAAVPESLSATDTETVRGLMQSSYAGGYRLALVSNILAALAAAVAGFWIPKRLPKT